jgi:hypothetical protein
METVSTLVSVFVILVMGAFLTYMTRDRLAALKADLARLESRFDTLEARMDAGFNALRSDLTAVLLAVRGETARPTREAGQP